MFDDWKQAWRDAVENFHREAGGGDGAPPRLRAMERDLTSVSGALGRLDEEIRRTRRGLEKEREAEQVCRRREGLARAVNDEETVRIAAEYAQRHAERAAVLDRKIQVLDEERALLSRDVAEMRRTLQELAPSTPAAGVGDGTAGASHATHDDAHARAGRLQRRESTDPYPWGRRAPPPSR